ncbi:DUF1554 domain-containing protein [Leptospira sarikeiensis]|uniref:DUF1554 domain-containing protein n=1 Tax=Leptospira sarikeiensis TaxID=2484943 RepID=A0A4R9K5R5_9LEPT|nr:DUF1554 domain-containing protein [Leptospira sarikeiensis]TGL60637.1 DUF1554 domain-containing protein [Leptospira sarikeiensis]
MKALFGKPTSIIVGLYFLVLILGCAIPSDNSGDPSTKEYYENAIINCLLNGCDREINITGGNQLAENGTLVLSVSLVHQPETSSATYNFTISNPAIASIAPSSLIFTPEDYSTPQTLTILGQPDDADSKNDTLILSILTPDSGTIPYPIQQLDNDKFLFATDPLYAGNLSTTFADVICQSEAESRYSSSPPLPAGTYKAFIVAGTFRQASPSFINWVLKPNKEYIDFDSGSFSKAYDTDGTSLFVFGSGNGINSGSNGHWTGMQPTWPTGNTCLDWGSSSNAELGNFGNSMDPTSGGIFSGAPDFCNAVKSLVCIQQ